MWIANFFKNIFSMKRVRDESGSGLITVIGVTMVLVVVASAITSSLIMSSTMTSSKLALQQADQASKSAINAVSQKLLQNSGVNKDSCRFNSLESTGDPKYQFNAYRSTNRSMPTVTASGKVNVSGVSGVYAIDKNNDECIQKADRWIIVEVIGEGKDKTYKSEWAVFKIQPENLSVLPAAITTSQMDLRSALTLNNAPGVTGAPNVYLSDSTKDSTTSFFKCVSSATINGNVTFDSKESFPEYNGEAMTQACTINGNLNLNTPGTTAISMPNLNINGNVCSKITPITKTSNISGSAYKTTSCITNGTRYGYVPDLSDAVTISASDTVCSNLDALKAKVLEVSKMNNGENTFLDLKSCNSATLNSSTEGLNSSAIIKDFTIDGNVTLVFSDYFRLRNATITALGENQNMNFVVPSKVADASDSTSTGTSSYFYNSQYVGGASGVIYTPHTFQTYSASKSTTYPIYPTTINGQIYAGVQYMASTPTIINYTPVGLPDAEKKIADIDKAPDLVRVF